MKLINGDCLKVLPTLADKSINLILTDPPYVTTACKWDSVIPFEPMWNQLKRVIKDNGCIALFGSEPFSSALRMSNIKQFKYDWVWQKSKCGSPLTAKYKPLTKHILMLKIQEQDTQFQLFLFNKNGEGKTNYTQPKNLLIYLNI
jgi:hypothetical protein